MEPKSIVKLISSTSVICHPSVHERANWQLSWDSVFGDAFMSHRKADDKYRFALFAIILLLVLPLWLRL